MARVSIGQAYRTAALVLSAIVAATMPGCPAEASAFLEPPGSGQIISELSFSNSNRYYDGHGRLLPVASYRKFELSSYIEYGVVPRVAIILQPSADHIETGGLQPAHYTGVGTTDVGLKFGLYEAPGVAFSFQTTVRAPPIRDGSPALVGNRDAEADIRFLAAKGGIIAGYETFVDVEAAYRTRGDGWANEVHVDLTLGVRPIPRILLLAQLFNVIATGTAPQHTSWSKFQGSVVYDLDPAWSVVAGGFVTVAGRDAGRELGPLVAVWYRF